MEKNWIQKNSMHLFTNGLILLVIALVSAFFVDFQGWKEERRAMEIRMEGRINLLEISQKLTEQEMGMSESEIMAIRNDIKEIRRSIDNLADELGAYRFRTRGGSDKSSKK